MPDELEQARADQRNDPRGNTGYIVHDWFTHSCGHREYHSIYMDRNHRLKAARAAVALLHSTPCSACQGEAV